MVRGDGMTYNRRGESQREAVLRRVIIYGVAVFILCVAQCSFFTRLSFLDVVPDIVMGVVAVIALLDSQKTALICAIASGFLLDAIGGAGISLMPFAFFLVAIVASEISKKMLVSIFTWIIVLSASAFTKAVFSLMYIFLSYEGIVVSTVIKTIIAPEFFLTLLFSLPLFYIMKPLSRLVDAKSKFKI